MQDMNTLDEQTKVVCANVRPVEGFQATIRPSLKTAAGPIRIGITAVLDPETLERLADPAKAALLPEVKTPEEVLPGILADLEKDTEVQVLMVQGPPDLARTLGEKFPGFDVVVGTSQFDPAEDAERLNDGKTLLITIGHKGKYCGVVGLFEDPKQRLRYQRVTLGNKYNGPAQPIRDLIEDEFQEMLKSGGHRRELPPPRLRGRLARRPVRRRRDLPVVPSQHRRQVGDHQARPRLRRHRQGPEGSAERPPVRRRMRQLPHDRLRVQLGLEVGRADSPSEGEPVRELPRPRLEARRDPVDPEARKAITLNAAEVERPGFCLRCHDEDNSPKFDFTTYWGQIVHKGLDQYTDPKVRQGVPAKVAQKPGS